MFYTHIHSYPQCFISGIVHTLVARPFTCGTVCFPLFLKVIEKGEGIIRALQVAVGTTFEHESILQNYYTEHNFPLHDQHSDIQVLKTNLLIRKPADIDIIIARSSSTMTTKMAAPIRMI